MTGEVAKTISTCMIWLSTAITLTWGLFTMNGDAAFFVVVTAMILGAALGATAIVWIAGAKPSPATKPTDPEI